MGSNSNIEWTDATWTPIRARVRADAKEIATAKGYRSLLPILHRLPVGKLGAHCERVSDGCEYCWSEAGNHRCLPANGTGLPFDRRARDLIEAVVDEKILNWPLHWRRPRRIFVCSQTDLFGEWVPDEMIDRVFAVMALCPHHTFQVLTKRAKRMVEYMQPQMRGAKARIYNRAYALGAIHQRAMASEFPFPNVWLGVSVEDQQRADERIPLLLRTPAAVRFLSVEPLLGPVDLEHIQWSGRHQNYVDVLRGGIPHPLFGIVKQADAPPIHWVIVGGESGSQARPCNTDWIRAVVRQCQGSGVACFVKQLGSHVIQGGERRRKKDRKGGDMDEWEHDLRVREMPEVRP